MLFRNQAIMLLMPVDVTGLLCEVLYCVVGGAEEAEASRISTALREVNTKLVQQKRALAEALERQAAKRAAAVPVNNQRPA